MQPSGCVEPGLGLLGRLSVVRARFFLGDRSRIVLFQIPLIGDRMREVAGGVQGREDVTGESGYILWYLYLCTCKIRDIENSRYSNKK